MTEIARWLATYGLLEYQDLFETRRIGVDILRALTEADLKELDIPLGDRKRLLKACADTPAGEVSRRQLTVVICDLVGSTELSTRVDDEIYRDSLRMFRRICKQAIDLYDGYIYQYRGDAVIAYFGYPMGQEKSAVRAAFAWLAIAEKLAAYQPRSIAYPSLEARTGVATGPVIVGADVAQNTIHENAVGVTPNLAGRLQSLAEPGQTIVSEMTQKLIDSHFGRESIGAHVLKGFQAPVEAFLLGQPNLEAPLVALPANLELTPMAGRSPEIQLLKKAWVKTLKMPDTPSFMLLTGEAGIGKSRVLREFHLSLGGELGSHLFYSCSPFHRDSAFYPIVTNLKRTLAIQAYDSNVLKLAKIESLLNSYSCCTPEILGSLASLLDVDMPNNAIAELDPVKLRQHHFDAITTLVTQISGRSSVLIVIEDLHWVDPSTLELMARLAHPTTGVNCLFVASARPDFHWPEALKAQPNTIPLSALSAIESGQMVHDVQGAENFSEELVREIVNKTDGIPLFIEETTRAVVDAAAIQQPQQDSAVGEPLMVAEPSTAIQTREELASLGVPATLQDSLMARLDKLGSAKFTALAAAVIGRAFSLHLLEKVLAEKATHLQADLHLLVNGGTLNVTSTSLGVVYEFNHGLLQNIAYESILKSTRKTIHSQVADVLLSDFEDVIESEPELLAHHLAAADRTDQSAHYWMQAGSRASQRSAMQETVAHYQRALALLDGLAETPDRAKRKVSIFSGLAATLLATTSYRSEAVKELASRAVSLCRKYGMAEKIAPFLYNIWIGEQGDGHHRYALELAKDFLSLAQQQEDQAPRMVAHRAVAWSQFNLGDPTAANEHFLASRQNYDAQQHADLVFLYGTDQLVGVGCGQVQALWCMGFPDKALKVAKDTLESAELSQIVVSRFLSYQYAGCLLNSMCRQWGEVRRYSNLLIKMGEESNFPQASLAGKIYQQVVNLREHKTIESCEIGLQIISSTQALGYLYMMPYWFMLLGDACEAAGFPERASHCLDKAQAIIDTTDETWHLPEIYRIRAQLARNSSDRQALFQRAIALARQQKARGWELRIALSQFEANVQAEDNAGYQTVKLCYDWFSEGFDQPDLKAAQTLLA